MENMPDGFSAVLGYRRFRIPYGSNYYDDNHILTGYRHAHWNMAGPTVAECRHYDLNDYHEEPAPVQDCKCGLHAWYTQWQAQYAPEARGIRTLEGWVMAVVAGWGRVYFDKKWWRAEKSVVLCFIDPLDVYEESPPYDSKDRFARVRQVREWVEAVSDITGKPILPPDEARAYASTEGAWVDGLVEGENGYSIKGVDFGV